MLMAEGQTPVYQSHVFIAQVPSCIKILPKKLGIKLLEIIYVNVFLFSVKKLTLKSEWHTQRS